MQQVMRASALRLCVAWPRPLPMQFGALRSSRWNVIRAEAAIRCKTDRAQPSSQEEPQEYAAVGRQARSNSSTSGGGSASEGLKSSPKFVIFGVLLCSMIPCIPFITMAVFGTALESGTKKSKYYY
eukprot:gnl/TRDRNA2_/TRDRNA2_142826_c0_seq1.p1 gnl/TRDRNA2_/TRDRNA2_142826_c0~~gnl/TRDRNA2_/TRDRNA2_142826_c0_seq1.p1  ORF type:complete len:126 (-),score=15.87 gnl/TRDRNA2_/TRDRNA2_142826_c0_seq1:119-496(-)